MVPRASSAGCTDEGEGRKEEDSIEASDMKRDGTGGIQWPLFGSPTLATIRVTSYAERGGTLVSLEESHTDPASQCIYSVAVALSWGG